MHKTIVLVEDQALFRMVQASACREVGLRVVGEAGNSDDAISLIRRLTPELVLLDLQLAGSSGFSVIKSISCEASPPRFLVMSAHCDDMTIYRVENARTDGFLYKSCDLNELKTALRAFSSGRTYFSAIYHWVRERRLSDTVSFDKVLSAREQEILSLIGLSHTDEEIAARIGITASTVKTHRKHLLAKLGYKTTSKLIGYAHAHGFTKMIE